MSPPNPKVAESMLPTEKATLEKKVLTVTHPLDVLSPIEVRQNRQRLGRGLI